MTTEQLISFAKMFREAVEQTEKLVASWPEFEKEVERLKAQEQ